jgi:ribose/xylose/arabinose/galactoside ABC-type transport system permease subunit
MEAGVGIGEVGVATKESRQIVGTGTGAPPEGGPGPSGAASGPEGTARGIGEHWKQGVGLAARNLFGQWEFLLLVMIIVVSVYSAITTPYFMSMTNFWNIWSVSMPVGVMMFPMIFIIMFAGIDLSVASMMAMCGVSVGLLFQHGMDIWLAAFVGLLIGALAGFINGAAVVWVGLPPLIVTLATQSLYRGVATGLIGMNSVTAFPWAFQFFGQATVAGLGIPVSVVTFVGLAVICSLVLRRTTFGRKLYAFGNNEVGATFSAVRVNRIKLMLFAFCGVMCALAGLLVTAQENSIRSDTGLGLELSVICAVLLGGVSPFGGSGNVLGPVMGLFLIGEVQYTMDLHNVPTQLLQAAVGLLLILSLAIPAIVRNKGVKKGLRSLVRLFASGTGGGVMGGTEA